MGIQDESHVLRKKDLGFWMSTNKQLYASSSSKKGGLKRFWVFLEPDGYRYQVESNDQEHGGGYITSRYRVIDQALKIYNQL